MYSPPFRHITSRTSTKIQIDELFEIDRYLARNIKYRLAFREFGTCLGIGCHYGKSADPERSIDLRTYSDSIIESWEPYMALSLRGNGDLLADDLRPITRVMYSSALIPGGEYSLYAFLTGFHFLRLWHQVLMIW